MKFDPPGQFSVSANNAQAERHEYDGTNLQSEHDDQDHVSDFGAGVQSRLYPLLTAFSLDKDMSVFFDNVATETNCANFAAWEIATARPLPHIDPLTARLAKKTP